jgi:hypothetical protein
MVCSLVGGADGERRVEKLVFQLCILLHHHPSVCHQNWARFMVCGVVSSDAETIFKMCPCVSRTNWLTSFAMGVCQKHVYKNPWESGKLCAHDMSNGALYVSSEVEDAGFFKLIQPRSHEPLVGSKDGHVEVCIKAYLTLHSLPFIHIRFRAY